MQEIISEATGAVVQVLITILLSIIIGAALSLKNRIISWIDTRQDKDTRELLHKIAAEGFAFVEAAFKEIKGSEKLEKAISYVSRELKYRGIQLSEAAIRAAIEKVVTEYNLKIKSPDPRAIKEIEQAG